MPDVLTDADLDPFRTTRRATDPVAERGRAIVRGDLILVDVTAYRPGGGTQWCRLLSSSPGSASVYPYKAQVPDRGVGQWRASEILAWARPVELHRVLVAVAR